MVVTEANLEELVEQYNIVPKSSIDQFSITLHLSRIIRQYKYDQDQVFTPIVFTTDYYSIFYR